MANTRHQRAVRGQNRGQQVKPGEQELGQKPGQRAGKPRERSRLRRARLSQDPVGMTVQGFLRLLATPRTQHRKRPPKKRDSGNCQARIYFGGCSATSRRRRRVRVMMCKCRGAQQKRQGKHQGGGLPFRIHGFSSGSGTAPPSRKTQTRRPCGLLPQTCRPCCAEASRSESWVQLRWWLPAPELTAHVVKVAQAGFHLEGPIHLRTAPRET